MCDAIETPCARCAREASDHVYLDAAGDPLCNQCGRDAAALQAQRQRAEAAEARLDDRRALYTHVERRWKKAEAELAELRERVRKVRIALLDTSLLRDDAIDEALVLLELEGADDGQ